MGDNEPKGAGVSVTVGETGVGAEVSEGVIARLGSAAAWLFPKRGAKVTITQALAQRVAEKIRNGDILDTQEQGFVSLLFEKEARKLANQQAVVQRLAEVLPEVALQVKSLPEQKDHGTSAEFVGRAETIASEVSDTNLRDMFARVLAGEISRPGGFSLRTLETVRLMDQNVAGIFDRFRRLLFNGELVFDEGDAQELIVKHGISFSEQLELHDAGLTHESLVVYTEPGANTIWRHGTLRLRVAVPKEREKIWVSVVRLTRPAREIATVLPWAEEQQYFREVGLSLAGSLGKHADVTWRPVSDKDWKSFD